MKGVTHNGYGSTLIALGYSYGPTFGLAGLIVMLGLVNWSHGRKIKQLKARLGQTPQALGQEVKMIGQCVIGVGNRVKHLEKQIRTPPSLFEQLLMHSAQTPDTAPVAKKPERSAAEPVVDKLASQRSQSRAEQALAQWMSDARHTA